MNVTQQEQCKRFEKRIFLSPKRYKNWNDFSIR